MATTTERASYTPLNVRLSTYTPHYPEPPQEAFLATTELEALYGGSAGGGKSDALLIAALQYVDVPGYSAILFRRTYTDLALPGAIMDRSKQWLAGTDATWKDTDKTWRFPSGATLAFGYLQTSTDRFRYQSAEFQFIGFDELTQFPEADYLYLFSRLRRLEGATVPLRMRGASNPGGLGHRWVMGRFNPTGLSPSPDRVFIPAKLADNPHIDQESYRKSLAELDPQTRAQLEHGDWTARQPGNWVFDEHAIDAVERLGLQFDRMRANGTMPPPAGDRVCAGVDWGDFRSHAVPVWELERGGLYVPAGEVSSTQTDVEDITRAILASVGRLGHWFGEERYDASFKQSNRTFARTAEQILGSHNALRRTGRPNTVPVAFGTYKSLCVSYLRMLLRRTLAGETTRVLAISPSNKILLEQMRGYAQDETGKFEKGDDDAVDSLIAGVQPVAKRHRALLDAERMVS